jgi:uncharacterized protein YjbI with pentapeptide repeats
MEPTAMQSATMASDLTQLDDLLRSAQQHESAVALALDLADDIGLLVSAARLRQILCHARSLLDQIRERTSYRDVSHVLAFDEATRGMHELLRRVRAAVEAPDFPKIAQWFMATRQSIVPSNGPHLHELDARGVDLAGARIFGVHIARCRLITDLRGAAFVDAILEMCDFTYSNLRNTLWQCTHVHYSYFRDSSFVDATLDRLLFIDCDLRRANFSVTDGCVLVAPTDVEFVGCDLRDSNWHGRDLSRVKMTDCKLHGVSGLGLTDQLQITRGDISPSGDGSRITCVEPREPQAERDQVGAHPAPNRLVWS